MAMFLPRTPRMMRTPKVLGEECSEDTEEHAGNFMPQSSNGPRKRLPKSLPELFAAAHHTPGNVAGCRARIDRFCCRSAIYTRSGLCVSVCMPSAVYCGSILRTIPQNLRGDARADSQLAA